MGETRPQGWFRDPYKQHEARYFSAGEATRRVRDGEVEFYDDLPAGAPEVWSKDLVPAWWSRAPKSGTRYSPEPSARYGPGRHG